MKEDVQGKKIFNEKLGHWNRLLIEWLALNKYYCDVMKTDAPYYYNERATIGVLAGAAWRKKWCVLEEFRQQKEGKRGKRQGRCDLYLYPANGKCGQYIEAKQIWIEAEKYWVDFDHELIKNDINKGLAEAIDDARKIDISDDPSAMILGVVFVCPGIPKKYSIKLHNHIHELIKISKWFDCDASAWSFPKSARKLPGGGKYSNLIYPGILLLANIVKR